MVNGVFLLLLFFKQGVSKGYKGICTPKIGKIGFNSYEEYVANLVNYCQKNYTV